MERRSLIAVILCFTIFFAWQKFYIEPRLPKPTSAPTAQAPVATQNSTGTQTAAQPQAALQKSQDKPQLAPKTETLELSTGRAVVSNGSRIFADWDIKAYRLGISADAAKVDLKSVTLQEGAVEVAFDRPELSYLSGVRGELKTRDDGSVAWTYEDANIRMLRETVGAPGQAYVDVKVTTEFKTQAPKFAFVSMASQGSEDDAEAMDKQLVYWTQKSIERTGLSDLKPVEEVQTGVKWIGATSRYFLVSVINQAAEEPKAVLQSLGEHHGRASLVYPVTGNSITLPFRVFFGPKELNTLRSVEPTLDHTVDFGWFTVFAYPMLKLMKWLYEIFHNYGVAIILLTLVVKILTYPLTYKSMKSMKEMARIQPQLQKIREKHANDKEALNREMITLMKTHGYNPMAGCLPILVQMPIFFALYRVLYSSIELYQAPFMLWINDLASKDPYYVTPVLLTLVMYVQQKLTPNTATDPVQRKMIQFMPVIFGGFMLTLPSGLTLYMLINAAASIVQQLILNKKLGMGNVGIAAPAGS